MSSLTRSADRVQHALNGFGIDLKVVELPGSTRTSVEAAQAIGCSVSQIAKSLIFKTKHSQKPVLIIASGSNRVNEKVIEAVLGEPIEKADADFVLNTTGFVIGGIPPVGHLDKILTFLDNDLWLYDEIWAAAGTPHAVFMLTPNNLLTITNGKRIKVT